MVCNGKVIYRGRQMITHCVMAKHKNNLEILKQKYSRYCATISQVFGDRNEAIDSGFFFIERSKVSWI